MRKKTSVFFNKEQYSDVLKNKIQDGLSSGVAKNFNPKKHIKALKNSKKLNG